MEKFDSMLEKMEVGHSWTQEEIETYMRTYSDKKEDSFEIRNYDFGEEARINQLFSGIDHGRHNVSSLEDEGNRVIVKYNEGTDEIIAAAAYKGDNTQRFISIIAADQKHRNQGHAKSLLNKISSGTRQVACTVHRDNIASIGMFESNQFKAVSTSGEYIGLIKDIYSNSQ